jgi:hypothetical protein
MQQGNPARGSCFLKAFRQTGDQLFRHSMPTSRTSDQDRITIMNELDSGGEINNLQ